MCVNYMRIPHSGFFEGEILLKFHKLMAICENFSLKIFTNQNIILTLYNFTHVPVMPEKNVAVKVNKCVKADSDAISPNSSGVLVQNIPLSRIDAINDDVKPVVETIVDKGKMTRETYKNFLQMRRRQV